MTLTPEQFIARIAKQPPAPAYLFLGQEAYQRRLCKNALLDRISPGDLRIDGFTHTDLENATVSEVFDDARSLSLFATDRVIWVSSAELALPRRLAEAADAGDPAAKPARFELAVYLESPSPGTVLVFECSRYDFAGDDRAKVERVQKFYADLPTVEFRHYTPESSRFLAQQLVKQHGLKLAGAELALLLDAVAGDASRLVAEIEKLSLFVGPDRSITSDDVRLLVPNASHSTIFNLVNALGRGDRAAALQSLDILFREGEYMPLALTFLNTQFRLALAAKEARVTSAQQAQTFFARINVRIWRERAEQIVSTAAVFTQDRLAAAVRLIYQTDKKFREGYKDDRLVMEGLVLALTAASASNV
ncbi:MAG: DNA polymerase III subunit delta [Acidobacteriaceae bacterium]|nr:DNA polymerase III subunit delta [Acidobacteriaceae bacterium]